MSFCENAGTHRYWHALYYAEIVSEPLYGLYPLYLSTIMMALLIPGLYTVGRTGNCG